MFEDVLSGVFLNVGRNRLSEMQGFSMKCQEITAKKRVIGKLYAKIFKGVDESNSIEATVCCTGNAYMYNP